MAAALVRSDANSPLKKREEIWGESYLAVTYGIITGDSNGPTSHWEIKLSPGFFSFFYKAN